MTITKRSALMILALFVFAVPFLLLSPAAAQPGKPMMPDVPRLFGNFAPKTGVWAQYAVVDKAGGTESKMRMAIVGAEGDSYWYEVWLEDKGTKNIIKMLVTGDPNDSDNIKRLIIKSGDTPAMEMPMDFVVLGRKMAVHMFESRSGVEESTDTGVKVQKVGERTVTVPAGTFKTTQNRIVDSAGKEMGTYDLTDEVPPFGVVLSETGSASMKLLAHGTDAATGITEEPVPMQMPPGMPQGMPRGRPPGMGAGPPPGR